MLMCERKCQVLKSITAKTDKRRKTDRKYQRPESSLSWCLRLNNYQNYQQWLFFFECSAQYWWTIYLHQSGATFNSPHGLMMLWIRSAWVLRISQLSTEDWLRTVSNWLSLCCIIILLSRHSIPMSGSCVMDFFHVSLKCNAFYPSCFIGMRDVG